MASARNEVLSGNYKGWSVCRMGGCASIGYEFPLNKEKISGYELLSEDKVKSASSALIRGAIGSAVLGPVGLLAGLSAKNKGIYLVAIEWKDGQKSLLELDDSHYKSFLNGMF